MDWKLNATNNLLQLSESCNLKDALSEWFYTGDIEDVGGAVETCELCNHPNIRYKFEIMNKYNNNTMYVGSECIGKFEIQGISQSGIILSKEETIKKVRTDKRRFIQDVKTKEVLNSLVALSNKDPEFARTSESFYEYYQERGAFTPNQLSLLIYKLDKNRIRYNKYYFKMTIRRSREKEQLLNMEGYKVKNIWNCMSNSQIIWFKENYRNKNNKPLNYDFFY